MGHINDRLDYQLWDHVFCNIIKGNYDFNDVWWPSLVGELNYSRFRNPIRGIDGQFETEGQEGGA